MQEMIIHKNLKQSTVLLQSGAITFILNISSNLKNLVFQIAGCRLEKVNETHYDFC